MLVRRILDNVQSVLVSGVERHDSLIAALVDVTRVHGPGLRKLLNWHEELDQGRFRGVSDGWPIEVELFGKESLTLLFKLLGLEGTLLSVFDMSNLVQVFLRDGDVELGSGGTDSDSVEHLKSW